MSGMTKEQFDRVMEMTRKSILQILKDDGVKEETINKIESLNRKARLLSPRTKTGVELPPSLIS